MLEQIKSEISRWVMNGTDSPSELAAEIVMIVAAAAPEEIEEAARAVRSSQGSAGVMEYSVPVEIWSKLNV